jgi:lysophospholipase L1-like esterase
MKSIRIVFLGLAFALAGLCASESSTSAEFPFKPNDRVAWIGSSSTRIGTWCRTMEFLLRTRHPELNLTFFRGTTGGGTFATGIKYLPGWLDQAKPTYVLFNYGGNDAAGGAKGLEQFKTNMQKCFEMVSAFGARVEFMTPQSGDVRATAQTGFDNRKLLSETMLAFAAAKHWSIYDTHHPLERLQREQQRELPDYTINRDRIHLTDSGYIAWGFYLYDAMNPPERACRAALNADGTVASAERCRIENVTATPDGLEFTREDEVLPLLPPDPVPAGNPFGKGTIATLGAAISQPVKIELTPSVDSNFLKNIDVPAPKSAVPASAGIKPPPATAKSATTAPSTTLPPPQFKIPAAQVQYAAKFGNKLPPRTLAPLERYSQYLLSVAGLPAGNYTVNCEGTALGTVSAAQLAEGVNLNSLVLDNHVPAPWNELAKDLWLGRRLSEIGHTQWKFSVRKFTE